MLGSFAMDAELPKQLTDRRYALENPYIYFYHNFGEELWEICSKFVINILFFLEQKNMVPPLITNQRTVRSSRAAAFFVQNVNSENNR